MIARAWTFPPILAASLLVMGDVAAARSKGEPTDICAFVTAAWNSGRGLAIGKGEGHAVLNGEPITYRVSGGPIATLDVSRADGSNDTGGLPGEEMQDASDIQIVPFKGIDYLVYGFAGQPYAVHHPFTGRVCKIEPRYHARLTLGGSPLCRGFLTRPNKPAAIEGAEDVLSRLPETTDGSVPVIDSVGKYAFAPDGRTAIIAESQRPPSGRGFERGLAVWKLDLSKRPEDPAFYEPISPDDFTEIEPGTVVYDMRRYLELDSTRDGILGHPDRTLLQYERGRFTPICRVEQAVSFTSAKP